MGKFALTREAYKYFHTIPTRWMDNDIYGHINNVVYYSYFDTVVNGYLIEENVLDIQGGNQIGLVVETKCNYFAPLAFPDVIDAGVRVTKIGNSSVRYEIGLFKQGSDEAAAEGHFIHVYVDKDSRKPKHLADDFRAALTKIFVKEDV